MLHRAFAALAFVLAPALAHADVGPPPGLKYMEVKHIVEGASTIPDTHRLALVTTRHSERQYLRVRWSGFEGAVDVPGGYMLSTRFVALTDAQLAELAKLYAKALPEGDATRQALEGATPEALPALMAKTDIAPGQDLSAVAAFFDRDDLATSPVMPFRTTVDDEYEGPHVTESWRIEGLKDGRIAMGAAVARKTSGGKSGCAGGGSAGALAALMGVGLLGWRARAHAG
jgi:hypothetical protein